MLCHLMNLLSCEKLTLISSKSFKKLILVLFPGFNFINLYMIDVVTGHIVFHGSHRRSKGPVHVVHAENWAVVCYFMF